MTTAKEPFQNRIINHLKKRFELINLRVGNVALGTARGTDLEVLFCRGDREWVIRIEVEHQMRDVQYPTAAGWVKRHARPNTAATILISTAAERTAEWFENPAKLQELKRRRFPGTVNEKLQQALDDFTSRRNVYYIPVDYYQELVVPLVIGIVSSGSLGSRLPTEER
jgi:hypothetical protein